MGFRPNPGGPEPPPWRAVTAVASALLILLLVVTGRYLLPRPLPGKAAVGAAQALAIGGPFDLVDQDGRPVADRDFRGRLMLVYFGYT